MTVNSAPYGVIKRSQSFYNRSINKCFMNILQRRQNGHKRTAIKLKGRWMRRSKDHGHDSLGKQISLSYTFSIVLGKNLAIKSKILPKKFLFKSPSNVSIRDFEFWQSKGVYETRQSLLYFKTVTKPPNFNKIKSKLNLTIHSKEEVWGFEK